jgi:hypothetical protein
MAAPGVRGSGTIRSGMHSASGSSSKPWTSYFVMVVLGTTIHAFA